MLNFALQRGDKEAVKILAESFTSHAILCSLEFSVASEITRALLENWDSEVVKANKDLFLNPPFALYVMAEAARAGNEEVQKEAA